MAAIDTTNAKFDIGRVASRTFDAIRANFVSFFVLGLIASAPNTLYAFFIAPATAGGITAAGGLVFFLTMAGSIFVSLFLSVVLQAALTYGTISYLNNRPVELGRALAIGVGQFLPLLAIALLEGIGLGFAVFLLVVPALILYTMWIAAVPARIAERTGIIESFSRSMDLTAGYRWPIFGTVAVFYIGAIIAQLVIRPLIAFGGISANTGMVYVGVILSTLITAVISVCSATLIASIYYELRVIKEGVGPDQIASVFD